MTGAYPFSARDTASAVRVPSLLPLKLKMPSTWVGWSVEGNTKSRRVSATHTAATTTTIPRVPNTSHRRLLRLADFPPRAAFATDVPDVSSARAEASVLDEDPMALCRDSVSRLCEPNQSPRPGAGPSKAPLRPTTRTRTSSHSRLAGWNILRPTNDSAPIARSLWSPHGNTGHFDRRLGSRVRETGRDTGTREFLGSR